MATTTEILKIEVDNKQAIENINKQNKAINMLQKENKELAEQGQKNSLRYQQNAAQIQKLNTARRQNIKLISAEKGSLNELRANLARLTTERNNINATTKKGAEEFARLNQEILKQNESIKRAEERGGDFRRSVGNYSRALDGAKGAFGGLVSSIDSATGSTGLLNAALLANPFGIIVTVLGALVAAFTQTEEGAVKFRIVLEVIKSVLNDFIGLLAVGGKEIVNFFENPLDSLKRFGESISNFVIRRVEAVLDSLGTLGEAFKLLFEGEFSQAAETAKEGFIDLAKATNPVAIAYEELKEPLSEYTQGLKENAIATANNVIAQRKLEKQSIALEKQIVKLSKEEERLQKVAEDSTLPFQEQIKAQEELEKVQAQRFGLQVRLAEQERRIAQTNLDIKRKQGLDAIQEEKALSEAEKNLFEIRGNQRIANTENLQTTRQRDQDQWEQELDFIIDVGEKEREVFKRQAEDTSSSVEERTKSLESYQEALKTYQNAIRSQFNELGLSDEDIDRFLAIKDPKELAEAITALEGLSEVEKNRLREGLIELKNTKEEEKEVIKNFNRSIAEEEAKIEEERTKKIAEEEKKRADLRKKRLQDGLNLTKSAVELASRIIGEETKAGKALAIAAAGINTAQAVTKTLATGGALALPQAAIVAATGAAQIAKIKSTDVSGGGGGATVGGNLGNIPTQSTQPQVDTSNVDNQISQQEALIGALESQRYQVSVTEINEVQNSVQVAETDSTI